MIKFIIAPFVVWFISQTIKFGLRIASSKPANLKSFFWTYVWAGGPPSTHTAILTSSLYLVWQAFGLSPIFTFCLAVTMLWLYDMVDDHKRQEIMHIYYETDGAEMHKKIIADGYMLDMAGHTAKEIVLGAILGLILGILIARI